jgi:hypothetical protein
MASGDQLRHRGALTRSIAAGVAALREDAPQTPLCDVSVRFRTSAGESLVVLPLAEALLSCAHDRATGSLGEEAFDWSRADNTLVCHGLSGLPRVEVHRV